MVKRVSGPGESVAPDGESSRERIIRSTNELLKQRGLSVSMDEIAAATGLSRRTLFRHFRNRDELVAEALEWKIDGYHDDLERRIREECWLEEWLESVVPPLLGGIEDGGQALWELASGSDQALAPVLAAVNRRRRERRIRATAMIAEYAWSRAGGDGDCPEAVEDACAMMLTVFNIRSMSGDYNLPLDVLGTRVIAVLSAFIRAEMEASATGSDGRTTRWATTRH